MFKRKKEKEKNEQFPNVERTDDGYVVTNDDGSTTKVSVDELYESLDGKTRGLSLKDNIAGWKSTVKFPQPVRALLFLKSEEDRLNYVRSLPQKSINGLVGWFTYVLLKGQVLEKCIKLGISIPEEVTNFLKRVDEEVRRTGKITLGRVNNVIETFVTGTIAIAIITFGIMICLNPALLPVIAAVVTVAEVGNWFAKSTDKK